MRNEKPWWQSETIIGIAVTIIAMIVKSLKWDIADADIANWITLLVGLMGATYAIYSRVKATKKLK